ncbi:MAG: hypothetical protein KDN19_14035 [Verrucomicrobiae bacterium]|nr:hypothetical protein [Verrucomicrobiae bacterium]
MKIQKREGRWPAKIAPLGATVTEASIHRSNRTLRLLLRRRETGWKGELLIPPSWTFTSCLLAFSSDDIELEETGWTPATELIGFEAAMLSEIDRGENQLDLVFQSIRLGIAAS